LLSWFVVFRIDMHEMLGILSKVLDGHPKLIDKFNQLLPPAMPLSNFMHFATEVTIVI